MAKDLVECDTTWSLHTAADRWCYDYLVMQMSTGIFLSEFSCIDYKLQLAFSAFVQ